MAADAKADAKAAAPVAAKAIPNNTAAAVAATVTASVWSQFKVCVWQGLPVPGDVDSNIALLESAAKQAAAAGAELILFPELFLTGYCIGPAKLRALALAADSPHCARISAIAAANRIAVCPGFAELGSAAAGEVCGDGKSAAVYNSVACWDATGKRVQTYRKTHLWSCYEQDVFTAGDRQQLRVFELQPSGIRCAFVICFDVEFPEPARVLFTDRVELLLVPTALSSGPCAAVIPRCIIPTRASENLCFVAYSNFAHSPSPALSKSHTDPATAKAHNTDAPAAAATDGAVTTIAVPASTRADYNGRYTYCGLSAIVTPEGNDLARGSGAVPLPAAPTAELLYGVLHSALRFGYEQRNPYRHDRRPDLYLPLVAPQPAAPAAAATAASAAAAGAADVKGDAKPVAPAKGLPKVTIATAVRSRFVLFGDSLTQQSFLPGGLGGLLSERYVRHADVVNRGLSGYNTAWCQIALDAMVRSGDWGRPQLVTLWLGANDAALNGVSPQHIPLDEYQRNLSALIAAIKSANGADVPGPALIVITPPPVEADAWLAWLKAKGHADAVVNRRNDVTSQYAVAALRTAAKAGVPAIDFYSALIGLKDWPSYMSDGLHLNAKGYGVLFGLVMSAIAQHFPQLLVTAPSGDAFPEMPFHLPPWDHIDPANPKALFK